jgi:hypothetical protein
LTRVAVAYVLSIAATVLAWPVAKRRPEHTAIAALLTFGLLSDLARRVLREVMLTPGYAPFLGTPTTGWLRVARIVEQALFLGWPAGLAAATLWIHLRRSTWLVAAGYFAAVLGIAVFGYPTIHGDLLRKAYLGFQLACLVVAVGAILHWAVLRKDPPRTAHWIIALMVGTEIVGLVAGAWRFGIFTNWTLAQLSYCILYATLSLINGAILCLGIKQSPS